MHTRYLKVNLTSLVRQGTIEFRQHQGTVNADKAVAWIIFTQAIIEHSSEGKMIYRAGVTSWNHMMKSMRMLPCKGPHDHLVTWAYTFLKARRRKLAG